jgi:hypothetical protein
MKVGSNHQCTSYLWFNRKMKKDSQELHRSLLSTRMPGKTLLTGLKTRHTQEILEALPRSQVETWEISVTQLLPCTITKAWVVELRWSMNKFRAQLATTKSLQGTYGAKLQKTLRLELLLYPGPFSLKNCRLTIKSSSNEWSFPKKEVIVICSREGHTLIVHVNCLHKIGTIEWTTKVRQALKSVKSRKGRSSRSLPPP